MLKPIRSTPMALLLRPTKRTLDLTPVVDSYLDGRETTVLIGLDARGVRAAKTILAAGHRADVFIQFGTDEVSRGRISRLVQPDPETGGPAGDLIVDELFRHGVQYAAFLLAKDFMPASITDLALYGAPRSSSGRVAVLRARSDGAQATAGNVYSIEASDKEVGRLGTVRARNADEALFLARHWFQREWGDVEFEEETTVTVRDHEGHVVRQMPADTL